MPVIKPRPVLLTDDQRTLLIEYAKMIGANPNYVLEQALKPLADDKDLAMWRAQTVRRPASPLSQMPPLKEKQG